VDRQILITVGEGFEPIKVERFESKDGERYIAVNYDKAIKVWLLLKGAGVTELAQEWKSFIDRSWI